MPYLPYGLVIEPAGAGEVVISEPASRCLAGQLTLPYLNSGRLDFVEMLIPSSGSFSQDDLRALWDAGAELASWRTARLGLARREGDFGRPEVAGRGAVVTDWRSLVACANEAAALLARWPCALDRRAAWLPVGTPGGTEDLPMTERQAERRGYVFERDQAWAITQSARWVGQGRRLPSATVSALALAVVQLARTSIPAAQLPFIRPLLHQLALVARLAAPPAGQRDPDLSSWPAAFAAFATACITALAELQSSRRGQGVVPLLDTDELYEAWLATQVRMVLDERFGPWLPPDSDALAVWQHDDTTYELWLKPTISHGGRLFGSERFQALIAEPLSPDIVLSATRDDETELMVLDAKAWAQLPPESVLEQSAKYLYGIRRMRDVLAVPALAGMELVTCAPAARINGGDLAWITVTSATPTSGADVLRARIRAAANQLAASLAERERLASTY